MVEFIEKYSILFFAGIAICLAVICAVAISGRNKKSRYSRGNHKAGHEYERLVARHLRSNGYWNVKITGASGGDYGVDITARKGLFRKYAVQCKRYSNPVGVRAVQEVVGGMKVYNCNRAMVVTNNTYTRQARVLAEENDVLLKEGIWR